MGVHKAPSSLHGQVHEARWGASLPRRVPSRRRLEVGHEAGALEEVVQALMMHISPQFAYVGVAHDTHVARQSVSVLYTSTRGRVNSSPSRSVAIEIHILYFLSLNP